MNTGLIIVVSLAALGIISGLVLYFKTPKEKRGVQVSINNRHKALIPVFFLLGISHLLSWYWGIANIYALYFGAIFIIGAIILWIVNGSEKTNT